MAARNYCCLNVKGSESCERVKRFRSKKRELRNTLFGLHVTVFLCNFTRSKALANNINDTPSTVVITQIATSGFVECCHEYVSRPCPVRK